MGTDRNAACFCGSGKKYKKCHGAPPAQEQSKPDKFKLNHMLAYKGSVGRAREQFCLDYAAAKKVSIQTVEEKLRAEAASANEEVSCKKGCNACCHLYILASLQECDTIVHYLYRHDEALSHFLNTFPGWRERIQKIEPCFLQLNNLQNRIVFGQASDKEKQQFLKEEATYAEENIPCPFLSEGACSIYEVRPYVCAGVMSVSPPEWCSPAHLSHQEMSYVKAELDLAQDIPYFRPATSNIVFASMPFLVYRILENGWDVLAAVPGLEKLKEDAFNDPGMRAAMRDVTTGR
jgi:Fe-S-cluster containining protein